MKIATKNSSPIKGEGNKLHFHALAVGLMAMDNCLEFRLPSYVEDGNPQHMTKVTFSKPR